MTNVIGEYFIGGYTSCGYISFLEDIIDDNEFYTYILKSGNGTLKSKLLKSYSENNTELELFYCTLDANSIDAIILNKEKTAFIDGDYPHLFEPKFHNVNSEIVTYNDKICKESLLKHKLELFELHSEYNKVISRCTRYLEAIASILADTKSVAEQSLNFAKLDGFISRFTKKICPCSIDNSVGKLKFRLISALTANGYKSLPINAKKIYLLNDNFYIGTDYLLRKLSDHFISCGYDVTVSVSTLQDDRAFEHIIIPQLDIAFISSTPINRTEKEYKNIINFSRFYEKDSISSKKSRLKFNSNTSKELLNEAVYALKLSRVYNAKINKIYQDCQKSISN